MISVEGGRKMPCESCGVQFSVFKRKRACSECERLYCAACLRRGGGMCSPCRALSTRPLQRQSIAHLKPRDLQCFLQRQNVSTRGCVEKDDLVSLCVSHVNSAAYRRRGSPGGGGGGGGARDSGPFTALKGFTNNINDIINSAFDLRPSAPPPTNGHSNCYNAGHAHAATAPPPPAAPPPAPARERFTTNPGGERDFRVPPPAGGAAGAGGMARSESAGSARLDTDDCFEVEDLNDSGWEFVSRPPADPLPGDSEVLIAPNTELSEGLSRERAAMRAGAAAREPRSSSSDAGAGGGAGGGAERARLLSPPATPQRAMSELELPPRAAAAPAAPADRADAASLQDEPLIDAQESTPRNGQIALEALADEGSLETLSVRQLKELLARNRVEYRGCLERAELLARARTLYRDHLKYKHELDALPLEECCKICMAAPLECVLLECGHIAACTACAKQLAECPICRQYVVRAVRCFRS